MAPSGERGEDALEQDEDEDAKQIVPPLWECEVGEDGNGGSEEQDEAHPSKRTTR